MEVEIATSGVEIPYPYAIDGLDLEDVRAAELATVLPTTEPALVGDHVADGAVRQAAIRPLGHFSAKCCSAPLCRCLRGLGSSQVIGDYVLAHGYLRDDHVLDRMLDRCRHSRRSAGPSPRDRNRRRKG
ncbi:hypothetical protein ABDJ38_14915 [Aurantiacibacter sp. DGU5]|uniref:AMP nucleoside phosphorylase N-terminal domain-containing protein n=1 Tax=Aurantiacibacter flavus TaxID=3145232 RepID=A0ABV0D0K8_9SPHN